MNKLLELQTKYTKEGNYKELSKINNLIYQLRQKQKQNKLKQAEENYNNNFNNFITSFLTK